MLSPTLTWVWSDNQLSYFLITDNQISQILHFFYHLWASLMHTQHHIWFHSCISTFCNWMNFMSTAEETFPARAGIACFKLFCTRCEVIIDSPCFVILKWLFFFLSNDDMRWFALIWFIFCSDSHLEIVYYFSVNTKFWTEAFLVWNDSVTSHQILDRSTNSGISLFAVSQAIINCWFNMI